MEVFNMYYDEEYVIIESALDIYDEYNVTMEEAVAIAMEMNSNTNNEDCERNTPKKGVPILPLVGAGVIGGGAYALHKRRKGKVPKRERQMYEAGLREYGNAIRRQYGNPVPIIPMQYEEEDESE
jgi:hypothetical protein